MTDQQQKQQYTKIYEEHNLLGRGAYGSAFLVKNKQDGVFYVAKKMMLQGMAERDIALAWGQIEILKKFNDLNIPFIVQYKECYHFQNTLIIVMEYCEHGDLQTFLKNWKKKGELLDQRVIVNWFIQLLFGVKALHSKNVLHRDLKSANVFLTSNKTLKIGDFGISKVLDNTSAKTFVGTPYYLSPQVCQNRPYNLSSDLWSLGCIIYEMCTLNYPFQASNLLGLAMKILTDQVKPIPQRYSPQLNAIVMKLFIKNQKQRITIDEILKMPFMKKHMATFVEDQEKINRLILIGKKQIKQQDEEETVQEQAEKSLKKTKNTTGAQDCNEETMKTINSVMENTRGKGNNNATLNNSGTMTLSYSQSLTPGERLKLKKEEERIKREQEIMEEHRKNAMLKDFAKEKKAQNLASSGTFNQSLSQSFTKSVNIQKQIQHQNRQKAELKLTQQRLFKMQVINTEQLHTSINKMITMKILKGSNADFEDVELPQDVKTINRPIKNSYVDDRPIKPSKKQQYEVEEEIYEQSQEDEELEEYYDNDFEDYIEEEPQLKTTACREEFQQIKAFYQNQIDERTISPSKRSKIAQAFKNEEITISPQHGNKVQTKIAQCKQILGQKKYNELYKKIKTNQMDYSKLKKEYNQKEIKAIKDIEEIVYYQGER